MIICYLVIFLMEILLFSMWYFSRKPYSEGILIEKLKNRINWKKFIKIYLIVQFFIYLSSINNKMMNIFDIILLPLSILSFLLVASISDMKGDKLIIEELKKDKSFIRNIKINKLLKK